jgi:hypothetical protein
VLRFAGLILSGFAVVTTITADNRTPKLVNNLEKIIDNTGRYIILGN